MAHQAITVTKASPQPAAITLAADTTCLHLSGVLGAGLQLDVSPDGTLPYVPLVAMQELGAYATKPGTYNVALKAGCAAGEILHVGDHPERDVAGGGAFGFRTCLRLTEGVYPAERMAACRPDCTILHLDEVPALVAGLA